MKNLGKGGFFDKLKAKTVTSSNPINYDGDWCKIKYHVFISNKSDIIKTIVKNLNRDLKSDFKIKAFSEKYEFLLLSFMLVGTPPELFLATHTSDINLSSDQLATFLAKLFHKVLME